MFKIVVATDASKQAAEAREILRALPLPPNTELHVAVVNAPFGESFYQEPPSLQRVWQNRKEWGDRALAEATKEFQHAGANVTGSLRSGEVAHEIITTAAERGADLIVVGSRGLSGVKEFLLGSVARNVVHHAQMSVLVGRPVRNRVRNVVVAVDNSPHSVAALELIQKWPLNACTTVTLVHVRRPYHPAPLEAPIAADGNLEGEHHDQVEAQQIVETAAARFGSAAVQLELEVRVGDPGEEILRLAQEKGADLIVMGARGVSLLERLVLGSVADRVLRHAPCSVLLVR